MRRGKSNARVAQLLTAFVFCILGFAIIYDELAGVESPVASLTVGIIMIGIGLLVLLGFKIPR